MKKGIHPESVLTVFMDNAGNTFIAKSTMQTKETCVLDGVTYPLCKIETSSKTHPAYTGERASYRGSNRIEVFIKKYGKYFEKH